ncbi:methionyl-tRNA formyltransferase [Microbulbifer thermotolerans]|uniref:Methionyl-tRNA formyltransferase n=1 Tax=Microbulbifer thermotolerans TaxID=252514 RepID=A0A143HHK2_MICTH|nr:methionyl-tRNA formyltransferase [Microbulbifer thermotolerans]AMX01194.1 methionyl-tRNA formyltransferase [Microbulbifer thermotolerans]MCX2778491.1 methionyl-tRNA formyltransferase [Microbulbifer thermotolerans]MCX2782973.1 methionyl-tRNA formyltransferase [Microbulbifer thermotolerans]MCX2793975.1 methionyl-tRNA formyltransferase [Microbulbifer thermotolerans]MCX2801679.1 methionyl-tRNA formyltransferase [Microbulbifer thermotolerans]
MTQPLNIVFAGTPEFAAVHLQTLLDSQHRVIAAYTQPDRPAGRGKKPQASPVKQLAQQHEIPVYQPQSLRDEAAQAELAALNADLMVVVAYGLILPQAVLDTPRLGCVNVHASLLPRWRGAAPIQRAIEAGDAVSGVSIMQMEAGLDTGPVLVEKRCPITPADTGGSLHDKLAGLGGPALLEALEQLAAGTAVPRIQDDTKANYAAKISKEEARIDWLRPAEELDRQIRAFNPFPVCWTTCSDAKGKQRLRIYKAQLERGCHRDIPGTILSADAEGILVACGREALRLQLLQLPGKKALPAEEILKGYRALFAPGVRLGE